MNNILQDLMNRLAPYKREEVAFRSGVSISTVNKLFSGAETNPTLETLTALANFADMKEKEMQSD